MAVGKAALAAAIFATALYGASVRNIEQTRHDATSARADTGAITSPELIKRLKPVAFEGADMKAIAAGFQTAEDFAATVHAAKNVRVPFASLKREVVEEGRSLADAIHDLKPSADALLEADLARSEARSDLASIK